MSESRKTSPQPERWEAFDERERAQIALGLVAAMIAVDKPRPVTMLNVVEMLEEISMSMGMEPYEGLDSLRERLMVLVAHSE